MEAIGLAGLIAIIWKVVDFLKFATNKDFARCITQASVWLSAIVVSLLAREAEPFSAIGVMGTSFGDLSTAAIALFALGLGSTASGVVDFKKAVDGSDSAAVPPLVPGSTQPVP